MFSDFVEHLGGRCRLRPTIVVIHSSLRQFSFLRQ